MNETTLFLTQIMGPVLVIMGLGILVNQKHFMNAYTKLMKEPFSIFFATLTMLTVGTVLVFKHFLWGSVNEILVTIVGLGILGKGILFAIIPDAFESITSKVVTPMILKLGATLWVLVGIYFIWSGFYM